jgi:hypothetical protein
LFIGMQGHAKAAELLPDTWPVDEWLWRMKQGLACGNHWNCCIAGAKTLGRCCIAITCQKMSVLQGVEIGSLKASQGLDIAHSAMFPKLQLKCALTL